MRAITQDRYGSSDVLRLDEVGTPAFAEDEVLVRVRAAGMGPEVWHLMTGSPYFVRLMGFGLRGRRARFRPGSRRQGRGGRERGGRIPAGRRGVRQRPRHPGGYTPLPPPRRARSAAPACSRPSRPTSRSSRRRPSRPRRAPRFRACATRAAAAGQSVLIIGASGGVGTFAVQLAKQFDAHVPACAAPPRRNWSGRSAPTGDRLHARGLRGPAERYDLIVDTAAGARCRAAARADTARDTRDRRRRGRRAPDRRLRAPASRRRAVTVVSQRLVPLTAVDRRADLLFLKDVIEDGKLTPVVDRIFALGDAAQALTDAEEGHGRGKKVIVI